nr:immunoglobulin light chain junction region [Macaca mulatta]
DYYCSSGDDNNLVLF